MNVRSILIPSFALFATLAGAQTPTTPPAGTPISVQSQPGPNGRTTYNAVVPGANLNTPQLGANNLSAVSGVTRQVPQDFKLVSGDLVAIKVFDQLDYNVTVVIDKDGFVELPYLGQVNLAGITIRAAAEMIASKLVGAGIYNQPIVQVQFLDGPGTDATVLGELHGAVPIFNQRSLSDVLSSLGGLPPTASHIVTINRPGQEPKIVDLGTDPLLSPLAETPIFPGDTIITGRAGVVFVVGAFKNPGVIPLSGNQVTTMLQLAATTGGPLFEAKYNDLRLIRVVDGKRTLVTLNIDRILHGKDPDPILQSNDILFLPTSAMKAFLADGGFQTALSLATTAVAVSAVTR